MWRGRYATLYLPPDVATLWRCRGDARGEPHRTSGVYEPCAAVGSEAETGGLGTLTTSETYINYILRRYLFIYYIKEIFIY